MNMRVCFCTARSFFSISSYEMICPHAFYIYIKIPIKLWTKTYRICTHYSVFFVFITCTNGVHAVVVGAPVCSCNGNDWVQQTKVSYGADTLLWNFYKFSILIAYFSYRTNDDRYDGLPSILLIDIWTVDTMDGKRTNSVKSN